MIKIKEKEFIMESIGVSVPLIEGFFIESVETGDFYEQIIFLSDQRDCTIICECGVVPRQEQTFKISINGMTGNFTYYPGHIGRYGGCKKNYFDSVNNSDEGLVLTVMHDATDDTDCDSMEEHTGKEYEKLNEVLESEKIKGFINGIKRCC